MWKKIIQSLNSFYRIKVGSLEKSMASDSELRESRMSLDSVSCFTAEFLNSMVKDEDRDSMQFFCVIFILFIKNEFQEQWSAIQKRMDPQLLLSFEEYLLKFGQSNNRSRRESAESKTHSSPRISEYKLLSQIDAKCEQIRGLQTEVLELKRHSQLLGDDNTKLRYQNSFLQESLLDKRREISVLNERCEQMKSNLYFEAKEAEHQDPRSFALRVSLDKLRQESQFVCQENEELKKELAYAREQIKQRDTDIDEMRSACLAGSRADFDFRLQEKSLINHQMLDQNLLQEQRISSMQESVKALRNKIVELNLCLETQKEETLACNKKWLEQRKTSAELDSKLKTAYREINQLRKNLSELEDDKLAVLKSNIRLKDESDRKEKK